MAKQPSTELPLVKMNHLVQIINGIVEVDMQQTFVDHSESFLEVEFKFSIMPNICLQKFVAIFGEDQNRRSCQGKENAKVEYQEAITIEKKRAQGRIDSEGKDILILQIGKQGRQKKQRYNFPTLNNFLFSSIPCMSLTLQQNSFRAFEIVCLYWTASIATETKLKLLEESFSGILEKIYLDTGFISLLHKHKKIQSTHQDDLQMVY